MTTRPRTLLAVLHLDVLLASLRARLLFLVVLVVIPALVLVLVLGYDQRQQAEVSAGSNALVLARIATASNTRVINETHSLLAGLSSEPAIRDGDVRACTSLLSDLVRANALYTNLAVVRLNGDFLCSGTPSSGVVNVADRHYFQRVLATDAFSADDYVIGRVSGRAALLTGYPLMDASGNLSGVLHAGIDMDWLGTLATDMHFPASSDLSIIDRSGTVLLRYPEDAQRPIGRTVNDPGHFASLIAEAAEGTSRYVGTGGVDYIQGFAALDTTSAVPAVYVSVSVPRAIVLAPADAAVRWQLLGLGVVAAIDFALAWLISSAMILGPLHTLVRTTRRLAAGDLASRAPVRTSDGEIGLLSTAFNEMALALEVQRHEREQAQEERTRLMQERAARLEAERFRTLAQNGAELISVVAASGTIQYASPSIQNLLDVAPEKAVGESLFAYLHPDDEGVVRGLLATASGLPGVNLTETFRMRHADGTWRHVEAVCRNLLAIPEIDGIVLNVRDVTERKALEDELAYRAYHDSLTQLPNRSLLVDRLGQALARAVDDRHMTGVLFVDLDDFKVVNDSLGHAVGDQLLLGVAQRLSVCVRPGDIVARLGGDEFIVLLDDLVDIDAGTAVAERILEQLAPAFRLDGRDISIGASIGVAFSGEQATSPDELIRDADVAMYAAKKRGKGHWVVLDRSEKRENPRQSARSPGWEHSDRRGYVGGRPVRLRENV